MTLAYSFWLNTEDGFCEFKTTLHLLHVPTCTAGRRFEPEVAG